MTTPRQVDRIVRAALRDALLPVIETPEFQERLANVLALHLLGRGEAAAFVAQDRPVPPAPVAAAPPRRAGRGWTEERRAAAAERMRRRCAESRIVPPRQPVEGVDEAVLRRRERQARWKREKAARLRGEAPPAAEAAPPVEVPEPPPAPPQPEPLPSPPDLAAEEPEPVPATAEEAEAWLWEELRRQGMAEAELEARLLGLSARQMLNTCQAQRRKRGLPLFLLVEDAA